MKKKLSNRITIQTESCFQDNKSITEAAMGFIKSLADIDKETLNNIKTSMMEAVSNSIYFAYPNKSGKISVCISYFGDNTLEIKVRDWGCGIEDITKARDPLFTTGNKDEHSGMWFSVMKSFSDKLTVRSEPNKGTTVIAKFELK